jgi:DNA-binding CsgD family transcriptional regulator
MAAYHNVQREHEQTVVWAMRGLAIADKLGFAAWAIHRLLPLLCEAYIWLEQYDRVAGIAARMRELGEVLDHRLGLASADAADALLMRFRDNRLDAHQYLLAAADRLESIPFVFHAARLRRNGAQLLIMDGRHDDAVRELRRVHDLFLQLGAERELRGTREELRSLGVRPPQRTIVTGGLLSPREKEIAELVAKRKSNKEIARALDISARTVSTHLSNIFVKLGVDSRGALADAIREH